MCGNWKETGKDAYLAKHESEKEEPEINGVTKNVRGFVNLLLEGRVTEEYNMFSRCVYGVTLVHRHRKILVD